MMQPHVPPELREQVSAALLWINSESNLDFELSGLVDYEQALDKAKTASDEPLELGLVLCDGEICAREQIRIERDTQGYRCSRIEQLARDIPSLLDPPEGVRTSWLDTQLAKHDFVLLLFYRGLW